MTSGATTAINFEQVFGYHCSERCWRRRHVVAVFCYSYEAARSRLRLQDARDIA